MHPGTSGVTGKKVGSMQSSSAAPEASNIKNYNHSSPSNSRVSVRTIFCFKYIFVAKAKTFSVEMHVYLICTNIIILSEAKTKANSRSKAANRYAVNF